MVDGRPQRKILKEEKIPRLQLQQVQQMHRGDLLPKTASSYEREDIVIETWIKNIYFYTTAGRYRCGESSLVEMKVGEV